LDDDCEDAGHYAPNLQGRHFARTDLKNPVLHVETRSKSNYRAIVITPAQTFTILGRLIHTLHYALTLTCAATALRASEILALRWDDVLWDEGRIRVSMRWAKGEDGETKTEASDGYVPMHPLLSQHLKDWHRQTPYAKGKDFVFPSLFASGKVPLNACSFVKEHLR
jgi:integrase